MMRFILERVATREWRVLRDRQSIGVRKRWADVATLVAFDQGMIFVFDYEKVNELCRSKLTKSQRGLKRDPQKSATCVFLLR